LEFDPVPVHPPGAWASSSGAVKSLGFCLKRSRGFLFLNAGDCGTSQFREALKAHNDRRLVMNWDRIEGNWKQFSGKVKEKWGQLTDDDLAQVNGNREQLEGILQKRYGYAKDQAKQELDRWSDSL
jgi:uncharacterized protein YjbJ (UPF0337 family)